MEQSADFDPDPRAYLALQGRILKAVKRWLKQRHLPEQFLWVRENASYGAHTHILIRLPPEHRTAIEQRIRQAGRLHDTSNNRAVVIKPERDKATGKPDERGMHTRAMRCGVLLDLLKTMSPRAQRDGIPLMPALGVRHRAPCVIHGKRSGTSQTINAAARAAASWTELTAPAELRAVLGGVIEAGKKDRQRRRKARQRVRRAAPTVPQPLAASRKPSDPFDVVDLAADFFD
jgi:hypothetical protein